MTAKNYTGMLSGATIPSGEQLKIFLLLPVRYIEHLDSSYFASKHKSFGTREPVAMGFYNERNSVFGEYIPLCLPLDGTHTEFGGIHFDESPMLNWLEKYMDFSPSSFSDYDYLERKEVELEEGFVITPDNVFDHISIAVEHASFFEYFRDKEVLTCEMNKYDWAADNPLGHNQDNAIMQTAYLCETVEHISRKEPLFAFNGKAYERIRIERIATLNTMMYELLSFDSMVTMMERLNLNFHLTGFNGQSDEKTLSTFQAAQRAVHNEVRFSCQ